MVLKVLSFLLKSCFLFYINTLFEDIRGLKHDMGNHLTVLENLYQKKEFIEAEKYTEKLKDRFYRKTTEMNTGNIIFLRHFPYIRKAKAMPSPGLRRHGQAAFLINRI